MQCSLYLYSLTLPAVQRAKCSFFAFRGREGKARRNHVVQALRNLKEKIFREKKISKKNFAKKIEGKKSSKKEFSKIQLRKILKNHQYASTCARVRVRVCLYGYVCIMPDNGEFWQYAGILCGASLVNADFLPFFLRLLRFLFAVVHFIVYQPYRRN